MPRSNMPLKWPPPTLAEIEAITKQTDPARRNLQITQTYHELTIAFTQLLDEQNVSWCAYATWASKTAGIFIRKDGLEAMIERYLNRADRIRSLLTRLTKAIRRFKKDANVNRLLMVRLIDTIVDEVVEHLGYGNLIVFEELAPLYSRMLAEWSDCTTHEQAALDRVLSTLKPDPVEDGGQEMLIAACRHYFQSLFEPEPKAKAELILLGNLLVGYHEQIRLQGPILAALQAPFDNDVEDKLVEIVRRVVRENTPWFVSWYLQGLWSRRFRPLAGQIAADWRQLSTEWMMILKLPREILNLGQDIPLPKSGQMFPEALKLLHNPDLLALAGQLDRTLDSTTGSAAGDWGRIPDRMNFIIDCFRSRQQDTDLYLQPFSDEQVKVIHEGGLPDGDL